jgi:D-arabinose 1-dehydrogenase-like Zn-dependent alcohol dehydrogenase
VLSSDDPEAIQKVKQFSKSGLPALVSCTDNVEVNAWALNLLGYGSFFVPLGLHTEGFKFNAFSIIFHEITVVGSVVASQKQIQEMLGFAAEHDVKSWVTELPLDKAGELPELYMDPHLKGRLVVKISDE